MARTTLVLLLLWSAGLAAQDMKVRSEHNLIPSVVSPFRLELEGEYDAVLWWLEGGQNKVGKEVTFEADPGPYVIRCYGLKWDGNGKLRQVAKKNSRLLVVKSPGQTPEQPDEWDSLTAQDVKPVKEKVEPSQVGTGPVAADVSATRKPLAGFIIQMRTRNGCKTCDKWKDEEAPDFVNDGAEVQYLNLADGDRRIRTPSFRVIDRENEKASPWSENYMTDGVFREHVEKLGEAAVLPSKKTWQQPRKETTARPTWGPVLLPDGMPNS